MRVTFKRNYFYTPAAERRLTIRFLAGVTYTVKRECGEAAIATGDAVKAPAARRPVAEASA